MYRLCSDRIHWWWELLATIVAGEFGSRRAYIDTELHLQSFLERVVDRIWWRGFGLQHSVKVRPCQILVSL